MAVSKRLRFEIFRRDNHTCRYCGGAAPDVKLTIDHVTPTALGGADTADNLVTACSSCNSGKTSSSPDAHHVAAVSDDALRWADAMKQAVGQFEAQEQTKLDYRNAFLTEWHRWGIGKGEDREHIELPGDWKPSIENFRLAGLPAWVWGDIVDAAMGRDHVKTENKFKYCCGIAWNKVTKLQEHARRIVGSASSAADEDDPTQDAFAEVALTAWGMEWVVTFRKDPSAEQQATFRESAKRLFFDEPLHELLESAEYCAWFESCDLAEGLAFKRDSERDRERLRPVSAFRGAWHVTHGEEVPPEISDRVMTASDTLYEAGIDPHWILIAAVWAATHGTARLHYGLTEEGASLIGVDRAQQQIEDLWATAWRGSASPIAWPSEADRKALRDEMKQLMADGWHDGCDVRTAAISAGAYRDVHLMPHLPLAGYALVAACLPHPTPQRE